MVLPYQLNPEMFINSDEFKLFLVNVISELNAHFSVDSRSSDTPNTVMNSTFIETPKKHGYFFAHLSKNNTRFLEFYDAILEEVKNKTIIYSLYSTYDFSIMLFYLSTFLPKNHSVEINGYRVKTTTSKVSIENKFTKYKHAHNRLNIGDLHNKKKLVFLCNRYNAIFLAKLFPESTVYSPVDTLKKQTVIGFEGMSYSFHEEIPEEDIPDNIIFDIPPKKYWPC